MTDTEWNARIDTLTATATAAWARYDAAVATHGLWSDEAATALAAAGKADDARDDVAREYRMELER